MDLLGSVSAPSRLASMAIASNVAALKEALVAQGVRYCVGAYVDIHGVPKGKFVPISHFEQFAGGRGHLDLVAQASDASSTARAASMRGRASRIGRPEARRARPSR